MQQERHPRPVAGLRQRSLDLPPPTDLGEASALSSHGAVYTKPEIVEFMLDLVGYVESEPLHARRFLEPSFGGGEFLIAAAKRLVRSWRSSSRAGGTGALAHAIRGTELNGEAFAGTAGALVDVLMSEGLSATEAGDTAEAWLMRGDFLLSDRDADGFDFVVGNPPYVRPENLPPALLAEYRARYATMFDRADLYVPFIERSLSLLRKGGCLAFICSDRWMKNRYGAPLRKLVSDGYHLRSYVDMFGTAAFQSSVVAYPAITVIAREKGSSTRVAHRPSIDAATLSRLSASLRDGGPDVKEAVGVTNGTEPWLLESADQMSLIRRLEAEFPPIEEAGCKVGIGIATGSDKDFIGKYDELDVEPSRKLPLATTKDIASGRLEWGGSGVINTFEEDGKLVDLSAYPRLRRYLERRNATVAARHVARKSPAAWFRTIDKVTPGLAERPKLLIPDIKVEAHPVYDPGGLYPHHNLYYVVSSDWCLYALQAVLGSSVTRLFIACYSTRMRNGSLRFQAQYLRRIRIPSWESVPAALREELAAATRSGDKSRADAAVFELYGLTGAERAALGGNGE